MIVDTPKDLLSLEGISCLAFNKDYSSKNKKINFVCRMCFI